MAKMTERELFAIGEKQERLAVMLASKEDAGMSAAIIEQIEAKEVTESGSIRVLLALQNAYGEQESAAFPRPGSTIETSDNPDKFQVEVSTNKGGTRKAERSFYVEFSDNTKEGKTLVQELAWISILRSTNGDKKLVPDYFSDKYPNPEALRIRESYLEGRRSTLRNSIKKAVALGYQFADVSALEKVTISFVWEDTNKTKVVNTKTPIRFGDSENSNKWTYLSLSQFMRLDVPKAIENGGGYQALLDTMKRAPKPDISGKSEAAPKSIRTADTFDARMTDINEALDYAFTDANGKPLLKAIKDTLHKAGSDQLILSLHSTRQRLDALLNDPKIQVRLQAILDSQDDE